MIPDDRNLPRPTYRPDDHCPICDALDRGGMRGMHVQKPPPDPRFCDNPWHDRPRRWTDGPACRRWDGRDPAPLPLEAGISDAVRQLYSEHEKEVDLPWCRICGTADGSWPCITRMIADDLRKLVQ